MRTDPSPHPTEGFILSQTMLRVRDPDKSLAFYVDVLCMLYEILAKVRKEKPKDAEARAMRSTSAQSVSAWKVNRPVSTGSGEASAPHSAGRGTKAVASPHAAAASRSSSWQATITDSAGLVPSAAQDLR